jgi:hypothetical protein
MNPSGKRKRHKKREDLTPLLACYLVRVINPEGVSASAQFSIIPEKKGALTKPSLSLAFTP